MLNILTSDMCISGVCHDLGFSVRISVHVGKLTRVKSEREDTGIRDSHQQRNMPWIMAEH